MIWGITILRKPPYRNGQWAMTHQGRRWLASSCVLQTLRGFLLPVWRQGRKSANPKAEGSPRAVPRGEVGSGDHETQIVLVVVCKCCRNTTVPYHSKSLFECFLGSPLLYDGYSLLSCAISISGGLISIVTNHQLHHTSPYYTYGPNIP